MLPGFLRPSYKRYKDDTDQFAFWLVNIARKRGLWPDSAAQKNSHTSSTRTQKHSNTTRRTPSEAKSKGKPVESKYLATPSHCQFFDPCPTLYSGFRQTSIKLRKDVTSHFLGKDDGASNERHSHFTSVLEKLCEALEWEEATENSSKKQSTAPVDHDKDDDTQAWLNRFAALTVEELQDVPESFADANGIMKVGLVEKEDDYVDGETDAYLPDHFFMVFCLLHDLQNWRAFISQTWTEYRDLKIDLMTASIVTDNAVQLAQTLIKEVVDSWPSQTPGDGMEIQKLLYAAACLAHGVDERATPGLTFNIKLADFAYWCYLPTASLLQSFVPVIQATSVPVYKPEYFGTYDPKADRANMSVVERFNEDKLILMELLPEFCMMDIFYFRMPASDKITSGFVDFVHNKKPTLWLSFAAQVLLDTHHTLRLSRLSAFGDLRMSGLRIARTIEDFWKLSETHPKPKFWPQEGDNEIKRISQCIERFFEQDPLLVMRQAAAEELSYPTQKFPDHLVFSRNPVLCGLIMTHLNLSMQTIGQSLVNQWYDVQQLAFLYNLAQQSSSKLLWPDIEIFIKIHGENRIFVRDRPKDAAQSLNRLEMVTGISSATRLARDSRQGRGGFHKLDDSSTARLLEPMTKVVNLFRDQYVAGKKINALSSANAEKLLNELSDEAKTTTKKSKKEGKKGDLLLSSNSHLLLERQWSSTHKIDPLQLLALIKSKLCEEEPVILFNYFGMHKRSVEMLRLIKAKEHHKFVQYFTPGYMPDESMISNLVILVHHVARGLAEAGGHMGVRAGASEKVVTRIVMSCADVVENYLKKNGDVACNELRVFCKNKTQVKALVEGSNRQIKEKDEQFEYWFSLEEAMGPAWIASVMTGIPVA